MPVDLTVKDGGRLAFPGDSLAKPESIVSRLRSASTSGGNDDEKNLRHYDEVAQLFDSANP